MSDKPISQLREATSVGDNDLFVLQQGASAKKLSGLTLLAYLNAHGGISSIEKTDTSGLVDTYTITFADDSTTTFTVTNGERGEQGQRTYLHIKWSSTYPVTTMSDNPDKYIGIVSTTSSTAPAASSQYKWYEWKGAKGDTGDTGASIQSIVAEGSPSGLVQRYKITLTNGSTSTFDVTNGKGISSITLNGNHAPGTTDQYVVSFNDGDSLTVPVYNGANGEGAVSTVAGIGVVGENGNVPLIVMDEGAPTTATVGYVNQIYYDTQGNALYICVSVSGGTYDWRGTSIAVDSAISSTSTNPLENRAIYSALQSKVNNSVTVDGEALTGNITTRLFFDGGGSGYTIPTSSWQSDTEFADFPKRAALLLTGVTAAMFPEVVFDPSDAISGVLASVAKTYAGGVYLYATKVPDDAVTVLSVMCHK